MDACARAAPHPHSKWTCSTSVSARRSFTFLSMLGRARAFALGIRPFGSTPEHIFFDGLRDRQQAQLSNRSTWKKSASDLFAGLRDRRQAQLLNRSRNSKQNFSTEQSFAGSEYLVNRMWRRTGSKTPQEDRAPAQETDIFAGLRDREHAQQLNRSG